jgi:uncharacterized protein YgiM (DUF1202 family)
MHFQIAQGPNAASVDWSTVPGAEPVHLEGITHAVTASPSLNMRNRPTTTGSVIASLRNGTSVAAQDEPVRESDGYKWQKVKAPVGGQVVEGWVANKFLDTLTTAAERPAETPAPTVPPSHDEVAADGISHRVNTERDDLNMRASPTTSAAVVAKLPKGFGVSIQPGSTEEADGYQWVKIHVSMGGQTHEGWVAKKFLAPA